MQVSVVQNSHSGSGVRLLTHLGSVVLLAVDWL